jgi:hypothetical protein
MSGDEVAISNLEFRLRKGGGVKNSLTSAWREHSLDYICLAFLVIH